MDFYIKFIKISNKVNRAGKILKKKNSGNCEKILIKNWGLCLKKIIVSHVRKNLNKS